jgi:hypothetical protein
MEQAAQYASDNNLVLLNPIGLNEIELSKIDPV